VYNSKDEPYFNIEAMEIFYEYILQIVSVFASSVYLLAYFVVEAPITIIPFETPIMDESAEDMEMGGTNIAVYDVDLEEWPRPEEDEPMALQVAKEAIFTARAWYVVFIWFISVFALTYSIFFHAIILIDFLNTPAGKMVCKALYVGGPKLTKTAMMGLILNLIWTMWSFYYYQDQILSIGNPCDTVFQCTMKAMQVGFRGDLDTLHGDDHGNIRGGSYPTPTAFFDDTIWTAQVIGTAIYYMIWTFILEGIIQGQIIDTFAEIRSEEESKQEDEKSNCLVCSLSRFEIESTGGNFETHTTDEHRPQDYLFYIMLLQGGASTDDTGIMSYIRHKIDKFNHSFMPIQICVASNPTEDASEVTNKDLAEHIDSIGTVLGAAGSHDTDARLSRVESKLDEQSKLMQQMADTLSSLVS